MSVIIHTEDPRANFVCGTQGEKVDRWLHTKETTDIERVDYLIPQSAPVFNNEDATTLFERTEVIDELSVKTDNRTSGKTKVYPLSFLHIKSVEDGIIWYKHHFPKLPDPYYEVLARYHWGVPLTHKAHKNEMKKKKKKELRRQGYNNKQIKGMIKRMKSIKLHF